MSRHLDRVADWNAVAMKCGFQLAKMAEECGVSERTLRRHFQQEFGITAKEWRDERRLEMAVEGLQRGDQVKAIATNTKFKHRANFSAFVRRQTGSSPTEFVHRK